ncbi:DUF4142 domain-containing protein [Roseomonas nepalensis]|uniref:DUF4142 domain-containing protein n=1 Tax=Muricoccus nepalensis TaxID=1854500 RepID=A0A502G6Q3_9PROT|nr:DUF4142 domain-containing protein [Roseomonas nepalensis]TPG57529.1 DUF4142 domain-containing protein [Roseomonas nepalensis]
MNSTGILNRRTLGVALAGATLAGCAASADQGMTTRQMAASTDPVSLRTTAVQGGTFLMQTAQLGTTKAQRPDLRRFATFENSEQQGIMQALASLGQAVAPPPPPADKATMLRNLQSANGAEFDRLFVAAQIQGHQEALTVYNAIIESSGSPASDKAVAILAADRIREHLAFLQAPPSRA